MEEARENALLRRGIDLSGLTRVYMGETELNVARDYATVVNAVPTPRNLNLRFYRNRCLCSAGVGIDEFFRTWSRDYERLERAHDYIQWLFPSPEASMFNYNSQALTQYEAEVMRRDPSIQRRLKRSVALFLDFLGLQIDFEATSEEGAVTRGNDAAARLLNVETNPHNFLRISRLVRCMGEVGLHRWQRPLLTQLAKEVFQTGALRSAAASYCNHWLTHVCSADDRKALEALIPDSDDADSETDRQSDRETGRGDEAASRQGGELDTQYPMTQAPSPVGSAEDSPHQAGSGASASLERKDTLPLEESTSSSAQGQADRDSDSVRGGDTAGQPPVADPSDALCGSRIFVDPESYSEDELQDLSTELLTNGAVVVASIAGDDLGTCTHVLCESERTHAFAQVEQQPEGSDVLCVNAR